MSTASLVTQLVIYQGRTIYLEAVCAGTHVPNSSAASGAQGGHVEGILAISHQLTRILVLHTEQETYHFCTTFPIPEVQQFNICLPI